MPDLCHPAHIAPATARGARGDPVVPQCTFGTTTTCARNGPVTVLRVVGEVDLANDDLLRTALDAALAARPAVLVVDLVALAFCSARGFAVLNRACVTAAGNGTGYATAGPSPRLDRAWRAGWTDAERPMGFPTVADAVLAASAHRLPTPPAADHPETGPAPQCRPADEFLPGRDALVPH